MRAISLLNVVPIAASLGGCTNGAVMHSSRAAPQPIIDDPAAQPYILPPSVRIRSISGAGTGCPAGSAFGFMGSNAQQLRLSFAPYGARIGPGLPLSLGRRNCQILIDMEFPEGWSFSVASADDHGFARLESGVSGIQQTDYYFQGDFNTGRLETTLNGPRAGNYQTHQSLSPDALVWSPCDAQRPLIIDSQIFVVNHSGPSNALGMMVTLPPHIYRLQWRRCPT